MASSLLASFARLNLVQKCPLLSASSAFSTSAVLCRKKEKPWRILCNNNKTLSKYQTPEGRASMDSMHFKPIFKEAFPEVLPPLTREDFRRSFDRKDLGRKPKKLLQVAPTKFDIQYPDKYTPEPLSAIRTGGRHPRTRRVIYRRIGGGIMPEILWIDKKRDYIPDSPTPIEEKVLEIRRGAGKNSYVNGTSHKALIGYGDEKRWIVATENMKEGQILRSSRHIGRMAVRAFEGDTYAVGALPVGTMINSIETREGQGAWLAVAAGVQAQILRRDVLTNTVIIQMPSKREIRVSDKCIATVGRCSNAEWGAWDWGKAGETRRRGIRPKSGLWHRKDGYCGRKLRKPKPMLDYLQPPKPRESLFLFT